MIFKSNYWTRVLFVMAVLVFIIPACKKDEVVITGDYSEIDSFIWRGLQQYYLWVDEIPNLADDRFADDSEFEQFLNTYDENHEALFYDLLYDYGTIDKWSWVVDDYVALENYFQGVTTSMGFEYGLVKFINSDDIFGYIQYIVPESPAAIAGLVRGEIFTSIDGQTLNVNNYRSLLFDKTNFSISFADIIAGVVTPNGKTESLTATVINENPIHYSEIKDVDGTKVAYLVYNSFTSSYDHDLNDLFGTYRDAGVQELILDLRYNGGGSVRTTTYLASMIYGTNVDEIFSSSEYNTLFQEYLLNEYGSEFFDNYFRNEIEATTEIAAAPINTLNLNKLYVLSTKGTASASELIINGLNPYLDVKVIGTNTHGKYVGSFTIKDYDSEGDINRSHTWAMQPITFKTKNSVGYSDFVNGFTPTYYVEEDYGNLIAFGDENDPLLKAALDDIKGIAPAVYKSTSFKKLKDSKDLKPFGKDMHIDLRLLK